VTPLLWRIRRLRKMSVAEIGWRLRDEVLKQLWRYQRFRPKLPATTTIDLGQRNAPASDAFSQLAVRPEAQADLLRTANRILDGHVDLLGEENAQLGQNPDWFLDIRSGRRAPNTQYCFDIPYRNSSVVGEVKYVWEPSRQQHLTVLVAAYYLTRDERFTERIVEHLRSWWAQNPFLCGIHWTNGIEIGIRLISWVWLRRLLAAWPGVAEFFERNGDFVRQLYYHQAYLAALPSRESSAANHRIAELVGLFVSTVAFPIFAESDRWRGIAATALGAEAVRQTYEDGLNRELATAYHGLVLELFLVALCEDNRASPALPDEVSTRAAAMADALAAVVDRCGQPPRQGDDDGALALNVDGAGFDRWQSLLLTASTIFGTRAWWPALPSAGDVRAGLLVSRAGRYDITSRSSTRPNLFPDSGLVLLRDLEDREDELWCRCDHGPLGFLATAAHGHADALAIEVRHGGVDILSDPGTYCYHGHDKWRDYFRSTRAHNTVELDHADQSRSGGLFLWLDEPQTLLERVSGLDAGDVAEWVARHFGYCRLSSPATHRRKVRLNRRDRTIDIIDTIISRTGKHRACLSYHLGPGVHCRLLQKTAYLDWHVGQRSYQALLDLPGELEWSLHRGDTSPIMGWYSKGFGLREPSYSLVGRGVVKTQTLHTHFACAESQVRAG
jgi:hypothetical protein